jgi:riboflavin kinase/FMN adenylyltransferase
VNLELLAQEKLVPAPGVYAVQVRLDERQLPGVMNIGFRPTFEGGAQTLEAHILDFNEQVYDRTVRVEFVERLRPETKFGSGDELKRQIAADIDLARLILADLESDESDN